MGGVLGYRLLVDCYPRHRDFILLRSGKGLEELLDDIDGLWSRLWSYLYWRGGRRGWLHYLGLGW